MPHSWNLLKAHTAHYQCLCFSTKD